MRSRANRPWRQRHGDLEVLGTWFGTGEDAEPCIVILPRIRRAGRTAVPCIVRLSNSWIYAEEEYGSAQEAAKVEAVKARATAVEAMQIAEALGLNPFDQSHCFRVTSLIRDHLGDLLNMPPKPSAMFNFRWCRRRARARPRRGRR